MHFKFLTIQCAYLNVKKKSRFAMPLAMKWSTMRMREMTFITIYMKTISSSLYSRIMNTPHNRSQRKTTLVTWPHSMQNTSEMQNRSLETMEWSVEKKNELSFFIYCQPKLPLLKQKYWNWLCEQINQYLFNLLIGNTFRMFTRLVW